MVLKKFPGSSLAPDFQQQIQSQFNLKGTVGEGDTEAGVLLVLKVLVVFADLP